MNVHLSDFCRQMPLNWFLWNKTKIAIFFFQIFFPNLSLKKQDWKSIQSVTASQGFLLNLSKTNWNFFKSIFGPFRVFGNTLSKTFGNAFSKALENRFPKLIGKPFSKTLLKCYFQSFGKPFSKTFYKSSWQTTRISIKVIPKTPIHYATRGQKKNDKKRY